MANNIWAARHVMFTTKWWTGQRPLAEKSSEYGINEYDEQCWTHSILSLPFLFTLKLQCKFENIPMKRLFMDSVSVSLRSFFYADFSFLFISLFMDFLCVRCECKRFAYAWLFSWTINSNDNCARWRVPRISDELNKNSIEFSPKLEHGKDNSDTWLRNTLMASRN